MLLYPSNFSRKRKVKFSSLLSLRICTAEKFEAVREKTMCLVTDSYGLGSSNLNLPLFSVCVQRQSSMESCRPEQEFFIICTFYQRQWDFYRQDQEDSLPHVPNFQIFLWGFWGQVMKYRCIHSSDCHIVKVTNIWLEYSALRNVNLVIAAFLLFQTLESGFPCPEH